VALLCHSVPPRFKLTGRRFDTTITLCLLVFFFIIGNPNTVEAPCGASSVRADVTPYGVLTLADLMQGNQQSHLNEQVDHNATVTVLHQSYYLVWVSGSTY